MLQKGSQSVIQAAAKQNIRYFSITLLVTQLIVIIMFCVFFRVDPTSNTQLLQQFYPKFQDANAMILIGFGFAYAFMKRYHFTSLLYILFMHAIGIQLYVLFNQFWKRVINGSWANQSALFTHVSFIGSFFQMASLLMGYGVIFGRTGPFQLLLFIIIGSFGYCLNQKVVFGVLKVFDFGGSLTIHAFGAYYGLMVSFILARKYSHHLPAQTDRVSMIFGAIGVFFLYPSYLTSNAHMSGYTQGLTFSNTILALTGSVCGCFISTVCLHKKLGFGDIQTATLMGGITALSTGLLVNPVGNIIIGFFSGFLCVLGFCKIHPKLQQLIKTPDVTGTHNLHGLPCILSGLYSCIIFLFYSISPIDQEARNLIPFNLQALKRTAFQQAGYQLLGIVVSFGLAIMTGTVAGLVMYPLYRYESSHAFSDQYMLNGKSRTVSQPQNSQLLNQIQAQRSKNEGQMQ